jgi:hypothetical protein
MRGFAYKVADNRQDCYKAFPYRKYDPAADGSISGPAHLRPDDPRRGIFGIFLSQVMNGLLGMRFPESGREKALMPGWSSHGTWISQAGVFPCLFPAAGIRVVGISMRPGKIPRTSWEIDVKTPGGKWPFVIFKNAPNTSGRTPRVNRLPIHERTLGVNDLLLPRSGCRKYDTQICWTVLVSHCRHHPISSGWPIEPSAIWQG